MFPKTLKVPIILVSILLILVRFKPVWERYPGGHWNILFFLAIAVLFIGIVINAIIELFIVIKEIKSFKLIRLLPMFIFSIGALDVWYNPLNINLEGIHGKVVFRACYEGTNNQARFRLRERGTFDIHWTGMFFYDEFFIGKYEQLGDTLYLEFDGEQPMRVSNKMLMNDSIQFLTCIPEKDSISHKVYFYYGVCQGLN